MEKYSHWSFEITGYHITIPNPQEEQAVIMSAWSKWFSENMWDLVVEKEYPGIHTVYYNYTNPLDPTKKGYDMLIGFMTKAGTMQTHKEFLTLEVPAQDYRYMTVTWELPKNLISSWIEVNSKSQEELKRAYGYDLDMYNADGTEVTLAVSVKE